MLSNNIKTHLQGTRSVKTTLNKERKKKKYIYIYIYKHMRQGESEQNKCMPHQLFQMGKFWANREQDRTDQGKSDKKFFSSLPKKLIIFCHTLRKNSISLGKQGQINMRKC